MAELVIIDMRQAGAIKEPTTTVEVIGESLRVYGEKVTFESVLTLYPEAAPFIPLARFVNHIKWQQNQDGGFSLIRRNRPVNKVIVKEVK